MWKWGHVISTSDSRMLIHLVSKHRNIPLIHPIHTIRQNQRLRRSAESKIEFLPAATIGTLMSPKALESRHALLESCTFQLHNWRPFHHLPTTLKTLDSSDPYSNPTVSSYPTPTCGTHSKRPCRNDRATSSSIEAALDNMAKLSLFDAPAPKGISWMAPRKRRRRGSRSVSGRSSDRSGTRRTVGACQSGAYATCSDFPVAAGTDSSGEMFVSGADANWASDASEANKNSSRREILRDGGNGGGERDNYGQGGNVLDNQGNDSGYGSEPGYRGDAEFGYGDEIDEEEDDPRVLFWGDQFDDRDTNMEMVGENTLQKAHHRCRRKKHDLRMVDPLR